MPLFFFAFAILLNSKAMVCANIEVDALVVFKQGLSDPNNILASWDPTIVDPCTWIAVTCNQYNQVTRLYYSLSLSLLKNNNNLFYNFFYVNRSRVLLVTLSH